MQRSLVPVVLACVVAISATGCGNTATCDGCTSGSVSGLALIALDTIPVGACVPTQIVSSETSPQRFTEATTLELRGDINWYSSSTCNLRATSTTVPAGSLGAIAYVSSRSAGKRTAEATSGSVGARKAINAVVPGTNATSLTITGARYSDPLVCVPYWVQALDASGSIANIAGASTIDLSGPRGATFYSDSACSNATRSVSVNDSPGGIFFVQYAIPVTGEISATADGMVPATYSVTVTGAVVELLAYTPNGEPIPATAGSCTPLSLGIVDLTGSAVDVVAQTVNLTATAGMTLYSDSGCGQIARSIVIAGTQPTTFYARSNTIGTFTVTASADGLDALTRDIEVLAGNGKGFALVPPAKIAVGGCYPVELDVVDIFGNPSSDNTPQEATLTGSTRLRVFTDAACTIAATTVTTANNTATVYVKGTASTVGATMTASAAGFVSGTGTVDIVAAATKLTLTALADIGAGDCTALAVGAVDITNNPADVITDVAVTLTADARMAFYTDSKCLNGVTTGGTTITALSQKSTVYVRATVVASYAVNATGGTLTAATTLNINVHGGATAAIVLSAAPVANVGSCIPVAITFRDTFANVTTNDRGRNVALTAASGSGTFFNNATCTAPAVTTMALSAAATTATAYYKATVVETPTLTFTATASGVATLTATVKLDIDFLIYRVRTSGAARPVFRRMAVDPTLTNRLWAQTTEGWLWRTDDLGTTWVRYCDGVKGALSDSGQILVSGAADHTAYLVFGTTVQRIDATSGTCPVINVATTQGNGFTNRDAGSFGIQPDGKIYFWGFLSSATPPSQLWLSSNQGAAWTNVYKDSSSNGTQYGIVLNPSDPMQQLVIRNGTTAGLYRSINTGTTFDLVSGSGFTTPVAVRYDPAHPGYLYSNTKVSADGGLTFPTNTSFTFSGSWAIDTTGALYRSLSGAVKNTFSVQRAPTGNVTAPVWTSGATIPEPYTAALSGLSVKADGSFIAVLTSGRIWTSVDNGTTYNALPPPAGAVSVNAWVVALDDTTAYAMDNIWRTYKTTDGGLTWSMGAQTAATTTIPFIHTSETHPNEVYMRPESFASMTDTTLNATHDGFVTNVGAIDRSQASGTQIGAISLTNPQLFYQIGASTFRTTDGGATGTKLTTSIATSAAHAAVGAVNPTDDTKVFIVSAAGDLAVFDSTALTVTTVVAADALNAAALEVYTQGAGFILRIVGATGSLTTSADYGASFGVSTTPATATPSCNPRLLASASADRTRIATACPNTSVVSVTANSGTSWVNKTLTCNVRQLSVVSNGFIAACNTTPSDSRFIPF